MRRKLVDFCYILFGTMLGGIGVALFTAPAKLASGGVNGIGTILLHLFGWDTGMVMLAINIPLLFWGVRVFGRMYGVKSVLGSVLLSLWVSFFGKLSGYRSVLSVGDRMDVLLAAVFGGALLGAGIGIVMKSGSNTGGTDIVAQIMNKYTPLPIGICAFIPDCLVILAGFAIFGLEQALFAVLSLYVCSTVENFVVMDIGTRYGKTAFIFSSKYEEIGRRIVNELHHGGTLFTGVGIFTGKSRTMLMAVVPNQQIRKLEIIVHEADPKAFMMVVEAYQVLGEGFVPIQRIVDAQSLN
jgi:uncharacterized membrane-anchored protein YitT (DUF2179 family)